MSVGEHEEVDQDFLAGFNKAEAELSTTTPINRESEVERPVVTDFGEDETAPKEEVEKETGEVKEPEPDATTQDQVAEEPEFKISKSDYEALLAKAAAVDELRAETTKIKDTAFGRIGGLQQIINELQASTKRGKQVEVTPQHFKELIDEGYEDLATMTASAFNRILKDLEISGTSGTESKTFDPTEINKIFEQRFTPEREALKAEIRQELAREALTEAHEDWVDVVKSSDFQAWVKETKTDQLKDRNGRTFAESEDAKFVSKQLDKYKAHKAEQEKIKQKQAARQNRIEAAVQPKGSGGSQSAQVEEDDFYSGFKGAQQF